MPNEDLRRFYPPAGLTPIPVPEPIEQEEFADNVEEQPAESKSGTVWVGSDAAPQKKDDGISDLFDLDVEAEMEDVDDLVDVDFDKDILDANENGDLEDLVNVSQEDIMGRTPPKRRKPARSSRRPTRSPTSMGGIGG